MSAPGRFVLDTDVCVYLLNGRVPALAARLAETPADEVCTTAITAAELRYGALRSARARENMGRVETFLAPLAILPFDAGAALHFARAKQALARVGRPIGTMDLLIASIALAAQAVVVTNNLDEFGRVPGLVVAAWAGGPAAR